MTKSKLTLCSLVALLATGQAFAHTGVRDKVTASATATTTSYNGFTVTHGCGDHEGQSYPVLGQSAVYPTGERVVWRDSTGAVIHEGIGGGFFDTRPRERNGALSVDPVTGAPLPDLGLNLAVNGYAGFSSAFATVQEIVDPNALNPGVVEGLLWKDGAMEPKLNTITPFKVTVPRMMDANVKQVNVRIGVINYCDFYKNAENDKNGPYKQPRDAFGRKIPLLSTVLEPDQKNVNGAPFYTAIGAGNGDDNRADWWFPEPFGGSALYNDDDILQPDYWTTLEVINGSANPGATGVVSVEPTGAAFDAILTGPNTRPFSKGDSNL